MSAWRGSSQQQPEAPPANPPTDGAGSIGARIDSVLAAAQQAATGIQEDARQWARQYMDESKRRADNLVADRVRELSRVAEDLMARAGAVARQSDELLRALNSTPVDGGAGVQPQAPVAQPQAQPPPQQPAPQQLAPQQPAPQQPAAAQPAPPPAAPPVPPAATAAQPPPISDGARLLAAQMAVGGASRDEIAWRLQDEFGIEDARPMLDRMGI